MGSRLKKNYLEIFLNEYENLESNKSHKTDEIVSKMKEFLFFYDAVDYIKAIHTEWDNYKKRTLPQYKLAKIAIKYPNKSTISEFLDSLDGLTEDMKTDIVSSNIKALQTYLIC